MLAGKDCIPDEGWHDMVLHHVARCIKVREEAWTASKRQKVLLKQRYDRGVRRASFTPGQLAMFYDPKSAKRKLRPAWRGPFVITGFGGNHEHSYTLRQIDGSPIPRTFHGDHLKALRLREGSLGAPNESLQTSYVVRAFLGFGRKSLHHFEGRVSLYAPCEFGANRSIVRLPKLRMKSGFIM